MSPIIVMLWSGSATRPETCAQWSLSSARQFRWRVSFELPYASRTDCYDFPDDVLLESQLTGIASELELSEDHVFLLSTWNVEESTKQFESRLFDNCVASYGESVKVLKRKRGRLGRQSHIYYLIRYHIKLGFLSLMSQDTAAAARFVFVGAIYCSI